MNWIEALRAYSETTGKYVVPKRGTKEYDEVKRIQDGGIQDGGAYNPNSVRCVDRNIRIGVKGTSGFCFKKGLKVGYRAGITKGQQAPAVQARPDLEGMTLRSLGDLARVNKIRNYSQMRKQELLAKLLEIYGNAA